MLRRDVEFGREELEICPALRFGVIHRGIGCLEQRRGVTTVQWIQSDADAAADLKVVSFYRKGRAQHPQDLVGNGCGIAVALDFAQADHEFIASQATDAVLVAQACLHPQSRRLKKEIADVMAERIVDVLEMIQIDKQHGDQGFVAVRMRDRLLQPVFQKYPVRQSGQHVVVRHMANVGLVKLALDRDAGNAHRQFGQFQLSHAGRPDFAEVHGERAQHLAGAGKDRTRTARVNAVGGGQGMKVGP